MNTADQITAILAHAADYAPPLSKPPFVSREDADGNMVFATLADGRRLATYVQAGPKARAVVIWDIDSGKEMLRLPAQERGFGAPVFSRDGALIATLEREPAALGIFGNPGCRRASLRHRCRGHQRLSGRRDLRLSARPFSTVLPAQLAGRCIKTP